MANKKLPSRIFALNAFLGGMGYFGTVAEATLPTVKTKKELVNGVQIDAKILEPLEAEMNLNFINKDMYAEMAKSDEATIKMKGSYSNDGKQVSLVATLTGPIDIEADAFKEGESVSLKIKMYVNVYHLELDGSEVVSVDLKNHIAKVAGVDIYEKARVQVM